MKMTPSECATRYGAITPDPNSSGFIWADEVKNCCLVQVPDLIAANWINSATGQPTRHIYCNKAMAGPLLQALQFVFDRGLLSELKTFDGCLMVRAIRGLPGVFSAHSWAMAFDINAATNKLGTSGDLSDELAQCFIDAGFTWGKTFSRCDSMHFSLAGF